MFDIATLSLFAIACLALAATPGPDMLLIASRSGSQGRSAGFASLAGIQAGTYCHAFAAALGLSQLFVAIPVAYDAVRYAGAVYLLFLAWQAFRSKLITNALGRELSGQSIYSMFRQGLITNLLNPKMALFVLALFPQFVRPADGSVLVQILVLATVLNAIGLVVNGIVIFAASRMGNSLMQNHRYSRLPQMFFGNRICGISPQACTRRATLDYRTVWAMNFVKALRVVITSESWPAQ